MANRVELDVRDFHRRGEEPFDAIMAAVKNLGPDDVFVLINSFEPRPLYNVMAGKGFEHRAEQLGPDYWRITFKRKSADRDGPDH